MPNYLLSTIIWHCHRDIAKDSHNIEREGIFVLKLDQFYTLDPILQAGYTNLHQPRKIGSSISSRRLGAIWHSHADITKDSQNIAKGKEGFVIPPCKVDISSLVVD